MELTLFRFGLAGTRRLLRLGREGLGWRTQLETIRQVTMDFIRWRCAKGYEVTPFRRPFWGKKAWHRPV